MIKNRVILLVFLSALTSMMTNADEKIGLSDYCDGKEQGTVMVGAWSGVTETFLSKYRS